MAVAQSTYKSAIDISNINKSVSSFQKGVSQAKKSAQTANTILFKQTRFKRESISRDNFLFQKRRESARRREQEDIIEASGIGGAVKRQGKVIAASTRGFLGRIFDFVGTVLTGWIINNLPGIIKLAEALIKKIQKTVSVLGGFITGITTTLSGFGSLIGSGLADLVNFDFGDSSNRVKRSMDSMTYGFKIMSSSIEDALDVLREPLDFGAPKDGEGEPSAPPPSSPGPSSPGTTYKPPRGQETTGGGKVLNPQSGYSYLRQLGVNHIHALGILANIKGESEFRIDSKQPDGPGIGLFQYSEASRKNAFLQNVPDYKTNWKGQIKYAIGEGAGPAFLKTPFSSAEEAADWWMRNWENPYSGVYTERRRKHNQFIKSFKPGGVENKIPQETQAPSPQPTAGPVAGTPVIDRQKRLTVGTNIQNVGTVTSLRGPRRGGWHGGLDIGMDVGTYISCKYPAIVDVASKEYGYGNFIDIKIPSLGVMLRFGHLSEILVKSGNIPAGTPFARSGNTGAKTTGPHVHIEAHGFSETPNQLAYGGDRDPSPYIEFLIFGRTAPKGFVAPPAPKEKAQIAPTRTPQQRLATTTAAPDRSGPSIVLQQPSTPQAQTPKIVREESSPPFSDKSDPLTMLNIITTQRLLLELAYT